MYCDFAYVYDNLMSDINYSKWADYIEAFFNRYNLKKPELILDLACGTGNLTLELSRRGYDMIGLDMSPDMLSCAAEKSTAAGVTPLWICQDMRNFELYGTMDVILCTMDSLNYILNTPDMELIFSLVKNYLNPGGLFIFDINSPYKLEHILGNNLFYEIGDEITYLWKNEYHPESKICDFYLTFFVKEADGIYRRLEEDQKQRAWSVDEVKHVLNKSELELMAVFDAFTLKKPSDTSERYFFVSKA